MWYPQAHDDQYSQTKVFGITDRPVYRPKQTVHYKFWVRRVQFDLPDTSEFADREFEVAVRNPEYKTVFTAIKKTDAYGGIEGDYTLAADAPLGELRRRVGGARAAQGRAERLGRFSRRGVQKARVPGDRRGTRRAGRAGPKITATIRAKYYFGSPVTHATVRYSVLRSGEGGHWCPAMPWDWFYGQGYWWFANDYRWYPGWSEWGWPQTADGWWRPGSGRTGAHRLPNGADRAGRHGAGRDRHGRGGDHASRRGPRLYGYGGSHRPVAADGGGQRYGVRGASRFRFTRGSIGDSIARARRSMPALPPAPSAASRSAAEASCGS